MPPKVIKSPCGYCNASCTQDACIQCTICEFWHHKKCITGMSNEYFQYLQDDLKESGNIMWLCEKCKVTTKKLLTKMSQLTVRMDRVEERVTTNETKGAGYEKEMEGVKKRLEEVEESGNDAKFTDSVFKEVKERESRQVNLVVHGLAEPPETIKDGRERAAADNSKVQELVDLIQAGVQVSEAIRYNKRLGAKKDHEARPLLLGFRCREDKDKILSKAPKLARAEEPWDRVNVVPDMTKRQRQEDKDVKEEAERKNNDMNEEEAKNWVFKVVGARGQRRMIRVKREEERLDHRGRTRSERRN
jgi:hypothetical protein